MVNFGLSESHNLSSNQYDKFNSIAEKHFKNSLAQSNSQSNIQDYFFGKSFQLPQNIGFSEDGLILLYNTYEVASYAQGYTEFIIPFEGFVINKTLRMQFYFYHTLRKWLIIILFNCYHKLFLGAVLFQNSFIVTIFIFIAIIIYYNNPNS